MDVIVVGAGIIGCAVARELAARGMRCTILDNRPVGGGATQASAGMLAPYVEAGDGGPLLELGIRSLAMYDDWIAAVRRESATDVEYRRVGTLEIALDPSHASDLQRQAWRDPERRWLDADQAKQTCGALGSIAGALLTPAHGYVAAHQLATALARCAEARGTTLQGAGVIGIRRAGAHFVVETSGGTLQADAIVLAAGAWTNAISVDGAALPPVRPVRGQLLHLSWPHETIETILWGPECYIVPRTDGTLLVGATVENVGFDERSTAAGVRDLLDAACELLPAGWGAGFLGCRVGLRPATPDDLPAIGWDANVEGLLHATGHYRNGVLLAPITAQLAADLLEKKRPDPALAALNPGRFKSIT